MKNNRFPLIQNPKKHYHRFNHNLFSRQEVVGVDKGIFIDNLFPLIEHRLVVDTYLIDHSCPALKITTLNQKI